MALIEHVIKCGVETRKNDLPGHVADAVKLCHQLRPSQVDADYTKLGAVSTVRKSERRRLQ